MKVNFSSTGFKGYDAAPLKNIYLEQEYCEPFADEMQSIAQQEGFGVKTVYDNDKWIQDDKTIIEKEGSPYIIANGNVSDCFLQMMKTRGIKGERKYGFLTGGDTFLGKYPNGEKWLLYGYSRQKDLEAASACYGVDLENIMGVPKPNFHIDMGIRPVGYPLLCLWAIMSLRKIIWIR